jgi:molecular chaperone GrpE
MNFKDIFKNKSTMSTDKTDKEILENDINLPLNENETEENTSDNTNSGDENAEELSVEQKLELDLANEKDKHLRLFAEFENYKRRTTKERIDLFKTANQDVLQACCQFLTILTER